MTLQPQYLEARKFHYPEWYIYHINTNSKLCSRGFKTKKQALNCALEIETLYDFSFLTIQEFNQRHTQNEALSILSKIMLCCKKHATL